MEHVTLLDLIQSLGWMLLSLAPVLCAYTLGHSDGERADKPKNPDPGLGNMLAFFTTIALQILFGMIAYKAGM